MVTIGMAAEGPMALLLNCMDRLKSILTSQDFGTEYQLLCTELSLQRLRILLWGESIGLDLQSPQGLHNSIIDRHDILPTIHQAINTIAFLVKDIEELRCKYRLKQLPTTDQQFEEDLRPLHPCNSISSISSFRSSPVLWHRMRENQKQKSFLTIAKWAICDARRFDERVKRLRSLIDGLEDISKAAGISRPQASNTTSSLDESPPPYSEPEPLPSYPGPRVSSPHLASSPRNAPISRTNLANSPSETYSTMKRYLAVWPDDSNIPRSNARPQLLRLTDRQFHELNTDVYDELLRRQRYDTPSPQWWLPYNSSLTAERNEVRTKLSTLLPLRFRQLIADTIFEYERRFPRRQDQTVQASALVTLHPCPNVINPRPDATRRGSVSPNNIAPPPLQHRLAHQSTVINPQRGIDNLPASINEDPMAASSCDNPIPRTQRLPTATSHSSTKVLKSSSVCMSDPTYKVLPAVLRKYNIQAPWEQYALYIAYGTQERCFGMEEKPLIISKQLEMEGKKPKFKLRRVVPNVSDNGGRHVETTPT